MKIKTAISYNLDLLCFINVMTGRKFFTDYHKDSFEKFYPAISDNVKGRINRVMKLGFTSIGTAITMPISSVDDFNDKNLMKMLKDKTGLKKSMKNKASVYITGINALLVRILIGRVIIPLVEELERAGFKEFWQTNRLSLIQERCNDVDKYMERYNPKELLDRYINFSGSDFIVYICSFARPHGIKLCGNNMIADIAHENDSILEILTHEVFHPPYDKRKVKQSLKSLGNMPWVQKAYKNQNPDMRYRPMAGFIEENIVEALGIYVAVQLGLDIDPKKYFEEHDEGSHVISPYFYDYLCKNEKDVTISFEEYFDKFVDALVAKI